MADPTSPPDADEPAGMRKGLTSYGDAGVLALPAQGLHQGRGLHRRRARPAGDRHHRHRQRLQPLPRQRAAADRGGEARRHARRRPADGRSRRSRCTRASPQPTSMYLRNLMSIDTEEMIRAQPMDAVVLIGGCDKTVPAQLMGAASADMPAIQLVTGLDAHRLASRRAGRRLHRLPALLGQVSRRRDRRRGDRRRQQPARRQRRAPAR